MEIISNVVFRKEAIYENMICSDVEQSDGSVIHYIDNDLILLFNQERLESLGQTAMIEYLNSITPQSDGLSELRKNCSDVELLSLIKSRHIQSRADLLQWSKYLDHELDNTTAELKRIRETESNKIEFTSNETPSES